MLLKSSSDTPTQFCKYGHVAARKWRDFLSSCAIFSWRRKHSFFALSLGHSFHIYWEYRCLAVHIVVWLSHLIWLFPMNSMLKKRLLDLTCICFLTRSPWGRIKHVLSHGKSYGIKARGCLCSADIPTVSRKMWALHTTK